MPQLLTDQGNNVVDVTMVDWPFWINQSCRARIMSTRPVDNKAATAGLGLDLEFETNHGLEAVNCACGATR